VSFWSPLVGFYIMLSFLLIYILSCSVQPEQPDWQALYSVDPKLTLKRIDAIASSEEKEMVLLGLLQGWPKDAESICSLVKSDHGVDYCRRYKSRPHLWTLSTEEDQIIWNQGIFHERLFFPVEIETTSMPAACPFDDNTCIEGRLEKGILNKNTDEIVSVCNSYSHARGISDCLFRASESWTNKWGGYVSSASLCQQSGSFQAECHHHLLLALAVRYQTDSAQHQNIIDEIEGYWKAFPEYSHELKEMYFAIIASRVVGVIQPFRWSEWDFLPPQHIHSALGLRLVREDEPLQRLEMIKTKDEHYLEKSYGPGTQIFQPKQVWPNGEGGVYFCDIRGGQRPTSKNNEDDILLALLSASAMMNPPRKTLIQSIAHSDRLISGKAELILKEL
jgi:hypothetical protein